jgi:hypothetical protein
MVAMLFSISVLAIRNSIEIEVAYAGTYVRISDSFKGVGNLENLAWFSLLSKNFGVYFKSSFVESW